MICHKTALFGLICTNIQAQYQKRDALITTSHEYKNRMGYVVSLALSDGISDIISLGLTVGSEDHALFVENNFRQNAEKIYDKILEILTEENK